MAGEVTIAERLPRLLKLLEIGPKAVADACRELRELGVLGIGKADLADFHLSDKDKEHIVWKARLYKNVPAETFEQWLAAGLRHGDTFSIDTIRGQAQRYRTKVKREQSKTLEVSASGIELYAADIRDVESLRLGTASAVITDPPYEKNALSLWGDLIQFADRVLVDHGWLVAMSGQRWLPRTLHEMTQACKGTSMRYVWTLAMHTPGGQSSSAWLSDTSLTPGKKDPSWLGNRNPLNSEWKPIFVYSKGEPAPWPGVDWDGAEFLAEGFRDFVLSAGNDKEHHKWGQPVGVTQRLIEEFVAPGALVVDPFLGGGTTAYAAGLCGRACEGFDIDPVQVTVAAERINAAA